VVNSPPGKGNNGKDKSKVSEIARQLFPDASVLGQLPKKRKPGETSDVGAAAEGKLIEQIDMDLSLAVIPVGRPREAGGVPNAVGFDTGQGNEKKPRSGNGLNNLQSSKEVNSNAGLPFQPCNNQ
jgi:thymidine phosphorylase